MRPLLLVPAILLGLAGPTVAANAPQVSLDLGINMEGVTDYSGNNAFVDVMKASRHWGSVVSPWDEKARVDALGWPMQDAGVVVLTGMSDAAGHPLAPGTYKLSFTGQATISLGFPQDNKVANLFYDAATNTTKADLVIGDNNGIFLSLANTKRLPTDPPGTGVTNVAMIRPQMAPNRQAWWTTPGQTFTTPWLNLLQPFSTLRAMDWAATNANPTVKWADRTLPASATQARPNGVAWEYIIEIANTLHKDLWVNVPDRASLDYISQMAALFAAKFDPKQHLYLEYSNEVWNYSFQQFSDNQTAAEKAVVANPNLALTWQCPPSNFDTCRWIWGQRRVALMTAYIAKTFQAAFGANAGALRPVYATQLGNDYYLGDVLRWLDHFYGVRNVLWGVAQAPYWYGDNSLDGLTDQQELANAAANIPTLDAPEQVFTAWALYYGLNHVTYEGGPSLLDTPSLDAKIQANVDPGMGPLVTKSLQQAAGNGVKLYNYFSSTSLPSKSGMWGAAYTAFDVFQPKYQALLAEIAQPTTPLTAGTLLPATLDPTKPVFTTGSLWMGPNFAYLSRTGEVVILVDAPAAGAYVVTPQVATYASATVGTLAVNSGKGVAFRVPFTNNGLTFRATAPTTVTLNQGLNVLRFAAPAGEYALGAVAVTP